MSEDLWPQDLLDNIPRTPKVIMEEQAAWLGPKTKNIVQAKVKTLANREGNFIHSFILQCNALGTYQFTLFTLWHSIELYPAHQDDFELRDEKALVEHLKRILSSNRTTQMVRALVAQAQGLPVDDDPPF